jgi:2'-5' RNA ligase
LRLFFALWPDAAARDSLSRLARDVVARAGGKAPAAANVHLTLAFLGEVDPSREAALLAAGAVAVGRVPAFRLALDCIGTFRGSGIAWAGASRVPAGLEQLAAGLAAALSEGGFAVDPRPFHAHVTLARRCRGRVRAPIAPPIEWLVERLALNASELSRDGPRYREVGAWPLARLPHFRCSDLP